MPRFFYQAKNPQGETIQGALDAKDQQDAQLQLQTRKLIPLKILTASQVQSFVSSQKHSSPFSSLLEGRVGLKQLQIFTRQFATLIHSGIPIVEALQILAGHLPKSTILYKILVQIKVKIEGGQNLSQAMLSFPGTFDSFYIGMIRAGESGGLLDKVLQRLATALEKKRKLRRDMFSASFYPLAVLLFALLVMMGIFIFVVPQFAQLYQKSNQQLPAITLWTIQISRVMRENWQTILFGLLGVPVALVFSYRHPPVRRFWDTAFAHIPIIKELVQKSAVTYFTQTLSSLLHAGVHMLDAIRIASSTSNNIFYEDIFKRSLGAVQQGRPLSHYLQSQSTYIPPMLTQMIVVGERSGNIDMMLEQVANFYEEEMESTIKGMLSLIEPLLIIVFGILIAFVIISIYLPIFNIANVIKP